MSAKCPGCVKTCTSRECAELFSLFSSFDVTARAVLLLFNVIETNFLRASSTSEFSHSLCHIQTLPLGHSRSAQALVDARAKGQVGGMIRQTHIPPARDSLRLRVRKRYVPLQRFTGLRILADKSKHGG